MNKKILLSFLVSVLIFSLGLTACGPAEAVEATQPAAEESPVEAPAEEETAAADQEPAAESVVGGTYRLAQYGDPDTLDAHLTSLSVSWNVLYYIGAALVGLAPDGSVVPWLAESWEVSEDGLVWTFHLRDDVKFTNGEPLTAQDYVFTFQRAVNPDTASAMTAPALGPVTMDSFAALDDLTFQITLNEPYYSLLYNLADPALMMPFPQKAFEEMGADAWASAPISCGPYTVTEWARGSKVVLTRNPAYNWGPQIEGMNTGAYNIETIEILSIPEYSTILAGMEAGEVDFTAIETKDVELLQGTGFIDTLEALQQGHRPFFLLNVSKPPFDDLNVRKAFNLTVNRDSFIQILAMGKGYLQYGPMTPSQIGYWSGVEEIGYGYDLEQAKSLMQEAGYTYGSDGMLLTPAGEPLNLTLYTLPVESWVKAAEIAMEQFKALGVTLTI